MTLCEFTTRAGLFDALAGAIAARVRAAVDARGRATLALSGGTSPGPLYAQLAAIALDWPRVTFALVDERWVGPDCDASNETHLRAALAPALARGAGLTAMKTTDATAAAGRAACERRYAALPLPFDSLLLGMGTDGHVASLLPGADGLAAAMDGTGTNRCAALMARPGVAAGGQSERMTLTLPALLRSRHIDLMIMGDAKREVLNRARAGDDIMAMPVRAILHQTRVPVTVWWAP